jgi:MoaA/NifB/PqqE/SkfB family radical SAM enzyme
MPAGEMLGLLRGLWSRESAYTGPFAVTIDVTRRCNLRCAGCTYSPQLERRAVHDSSVDDFDLDMFADLCRELRAMGTHSMIFCGQGEPLLHPRLLDLVRLAKVAEFRTVLITNGTLLDEEKVYGLIDCRLDLVRVSLWASSPEEYAENYPGTHPRFLEATLRGLALLGSVRRSRGRTLPRTVLHVVLNRLNWRSVDVFADLAIETGVDSVSFSPLHTFFGRLTSLTVPDEDEPALKESLRRVAVRLRASGLEHNVETAIHRYEIGEAVRKTVPCYIAWTHPRIRVDGTVTPCGPCDWSMGNLQLETMAEIWNGPTYRSFRKKILNPAEANLIDKRCDCSYCCHVGDSERIHRFFRWVSPLTRARKG